LCWRCGINRLPTPGVEEDWERDNNRDVVDFAGFTSAILEVVVLWAREHTEEACVELMEQLIECISYVGDDGRRYRPLHTHETPTNTLRTLV